ncbi:MAG: RnfH family protein [Gammaproteobacteria bacterium]|nr:RnfH family protein [Gammaproteobacteria bacterium]
MEIEVVDASVPRPEAQTLTLPEGTCVSEALVRFGWTEPEGKEGEWGFGVFGREVSADYVLQEGDRLEICPPLEMSPQEARRRRAAAEKKQKS